MSSGSAQPTLKALHEELRKVQASIQAAPSTSLVELALLHRDAVYIAMDIGDAATAMTHALTCLELARTTGDASLQAKAHVSLALVQADSYDDLGAAMHFARAETLSREAGDDRGVALVAANAAHFEIERGEYAAAVRRLHDLLRSPHSRGLELGESRALLQAFHVNYVVSTAESLMHAQTPAEQRDDIQQQLSVSAEFLRSLNDDRSKLAQPLFVLDVLDALIREARSRADHACALRLADEHVQLAERAESRVKLGKARLERSRVHAQLQRWPAAIEDAEAAVALFEADHHDLLAARGREALAGAYASTGQYRAAFETQRDVTRHVESLYRQYYQQRAQLGQIEQQARDAEVRAAAFAEAALRDSLTGVPNRAHAMQVLTALHEQARRGYPSSIVLMDLDHFKQVNDMHGHATGDMVLTRVAQSLTAELREMDCLARFGGEEFVIILPGTRLIEATDVCERLRIIVERLEWPEATPKLSTTASFGVAPLDGVVDLRAILHTADAALYRAKAAGRNAVRVSGALDPPQP